MSNVPFFNKGITSASFMFSGNSPVLIERLKIFVNGVLIACLIDFRNLLLIPS